MVRSLGVIFIGIIIAAVPFVVGSLVNKEQLLSLIQNQSLGIMATILALNVASVTFILGTLITIEIKARKTIFNETRGQLHHNIIFMTILFLMNIAFVVGNKAGLVINVGSYVIDITMILSFVSMCLLVLVVIAMYEIIQAVFQLKGFLEQDKK